MATIKEHYKNSTTGDLILLSYSDFIRDSEVYFRNGKSSDDDGNKFDKSILKGCVTISEKHYEQGMKKLKKGRK